MAGGDGSGSSARARTEARASTPAPTMFFAKLTVLDGTDAPLGSTVPAAAIKLCLAGAAVLSGRNAGRDAAGSLAAVSSESPSAGSTNRHKRPSWRLTMFFVTSPDHIPPGRLLLPPLSPPSEGAEVVSDVQIVFFQKDESALKN